MEKEKLALGGSFLSAIAASLCCIGPFVAVIVGARGFAAAGLFAQWRPPFLTITALMLAAAWYLGYRRPKPGTCMAGPGLQREKWRQFPKLRRGLSEARALAQVRMGGDCGGTNLLESGEFLLRKAESANEGGVRIVRYQGMESHERGDGFILPFLAPQDTTLAIVRRRYVWIRLDRILRTRQRQFRLRLFLQHFHGALQVVADCSPKCSTA